MQAASATTAEPEIRPSPATRTMEVVLRRLRDHPYAFSYAGLALGTAFGLQRYRDSLTTELQILALVALFIGWLPVWVRQSRKDPTGSNPWTSVLALVGTFIMGCLVALELAFAIVVLTLVPPYFTILPFPVAVLSLLPVAIASEYSHRAAVLDDPTSFPWGLALLRGAAVVAVGISFKVLALQVSERSRLQASLSSAERKAGVLKERQRLAREIHDTLAQGFASIIVHLERAEQLDSLAQSPARSHLELARSVAREGLEEARRMLAALRPEILVQRALPEALRRVCEDWSRRTGISATLSITGDPLPLHPEIELTVLRGMQEALTNIARHSGAKSAAATLSYMEDLVVLDVQDDGRGFVPTTAADGFGLTGMKERVKALSGVFSVESLMGEGTTVSISLPAAHSTITDTSPDGLIL